MSYRFGKKAYFLIESQCRINPIWLNEVPQGSILVSFMFYVIVGKVFIYFFAISAYQSKAKYHLYQLDDWFILCKHMNIDTAKEEIVQSGLEVTGEGEGTDPARNQGAGC